MSLNAVSSSPRVMAKPVLSSFSDSLTLLSDKYVALFNNKGSRRQRNNSHPSRGHNNEHHNNRVCKRGNLPNRQLRSNEFLSFRRDICRKPQTSADLMVLALMPMHWLVPLKKRGFHKKISFSKAKTVGHKKPFLGDWKK